MISIYTALLIYFANFSCNDVDKNVCKENLDLFSLCIEI